MVPDDDLPARLAALAQALARLEAGGPAAPASDQVILERTEEEKAAQEVCVRLLAGRMRSRAELARALARRDVPEEVVATVLDRLTHLRLINDAEFARAFVADARRGRALGRTALGIELRGRGIADEIVADALADISDDDEYAQARAYVAKKVETVRRAGPAAARRRLHAQLARRGYGAEVVRAVVEEALDGSRDIGAGGDVSA